eukprot:IDg4299t1
MMPIVVPEVTGRVDTTANQRVSLLHWLSGNLRPPMGFSEVLAAAACAR